jgi:large subunit ribosomal protein L47
MLALRLARGALPALLGRAPGGAAVAPLSSAPAPRGVEELVPRAPLKDGEEADPTGACCVVEALLRAEFTRFIQSERARPPPRHRPTPTPLHPPPRAGRAWLARELRAKSWDDLHALWFVLLKERSRLASERAAARARKEAMRDPTRLTKVRKSMGRIKAVLGERLGEHEEPEVRMRLKAFIDAM